MDLFLPQSGQTVGFTTEKNVLTEKPLPQKPCVLYLNQGNDADGNPILVSIRRARSARGNDKNVRAELLIENKYQPRESVKDDEFAIGRMSTGAVAADFNGDGRLDLWVTDDLAGLPFTTEETALRGYPAQRNIGREEKKRAITIRLPQFLRNPLVDGRDVEGRARGQAGMGRARLAVPQPGRQRRRRHPRVEGRHRRGGRRRALGVVLGGGGRRRSRRRSRRLRLQLSGSRLLRIRNAPLRRQSERALPESARRDRAS